MCLFFFFYVNRQVGQGEIRVLQDEMMDPLVFGAFFMHPDQGLSIAKEWVQVSCSVIAIELLYFSVRKAYSSA